ncbi:c-type cytochrome [Ramlibacter sp.]|uniref:c-type cytochrome n=1 Tax=Ramlibacter sp. TaxID=1917967 RepID=UPI002C972E70|nr:c-type cytochrome [Ramlibacter sp.]HWI81163.1 c-type cytochrome [Ramlibacter sp.]
MSSFPKFATAFVLTAAAAACFAAPGATYPGIGRDATPREVAAWDIDVRPDFKGLPAGAGSVDKGQEVWEAKCASCHGVFGESNQVFNPIVGGTTKEDIKSGHVAMLNRKDYPGRTTFMKLANLSTLWDYINRAMPWNAPKSLSTDEVYAVTAYLLNLAEIVPGDFTLSDKNIRDVQRKLPNRDGLTTAHGMWPGTEFTARPRPDVAAAACMSNCDVEPKVASMLPAFARNAHGNLAEQNRLVGAQRGVNTAGPATAAAAGSAPAAAPAKAQPTAAAKDSAAAQSLTQKNNCTACHAATTRIVGPSWAEIAQKHQGKADYLVGKIRSGGSGVWGAIPMPPQTLADEDIKRIAGWLAAGAGR